MKQRICTRHPQNPKDKPSFWATDEVKQPSAVTTALTGRDTAQCPRPYCTPARPTSGPSTAQNVSGGYWKAQIVCCGVGGTQSTRSRGVVDRVLNPALARAHRLGPSAPRAKARRREEAASARRPRRLARRLPEAYRERRRRGARIGVRAQAGGGSPGRPRPGPSRR